jgi:hypothetical protein
MDNGEQVIEHPEIAEHEWIDDSFRVEEKKWGTWQSYMKDGKPIITGLTKEVVINATRWQLKCQQEGTLQDHARIINDGIVGGKL